MSGPYCLLVCLLQPYLLIILFDHKKYIHIKRDVEIFFYFYMLACSIHNDKNAWSCISMEKLDFGVINHLEKQIAEVIIDEGVEINDIMVDEYHRYLDQYYSGDFGLLINKMNQ